MKTEQRAYLLEGEHVLWESRAAGFKVQEKPFSTFNIIYVAALILIAAIYCIAYVPGAIASGTSIAGIALCGCVVIFIPAILTYNAVHDCDTIMKHLEYIITDKRAIVVNKGQCLAMDINSDTPFKVEERPDGKQILFLGSTADSKLLQSRKLAVMGDKNGQNGYQGLVFYSITNAGEACKAAGLSN